MSLSLIGNNIVKLNTVDSTNNYAAKMINQTNVPFGTVIMSRFQTSGKGQRASNWVSSFNENLLFSVILDTSFVKPSEIFITNIQSTHLENFKSKNNIAKEKADIFNSKYNNQNKKLYLNVENNSENRKQVFL